MGIFEIDEPSIDVEALEERVRASIAAKRGVRFTDEELQELRDAKLKTRLRREDLPRGWLDEMPEARSRLPEVKAPPGAHVAPPTALYESGSSGLKGAFLRVARRLMRPFYRSTLNLETTLAALAETSSNLSQVTAELREGNGLLPRLFRDEEYGNRILENLEELIRQLSEIADRLTTGDGTAARLINDPELYEAVRDILVGVDESKMLRWLIRNRQKAGIERRYEEATAGDEDGGQP